jgi:hypothetical protein
VPVCLFSIQSEHGSNYYALFWVTFHTGSGFSVLELLIWKRLFRLDDDYRIDVTLPVNFGGSVSRIDQSYAINQKPIGVLPGCWINSTDPSVAFSCTIVFSLNPIVERPVDGDGLRVGVPGEFKGCIAGDTGTGGGIFSLECLPGHC